MAPPRMRPLIYFFAFAAALVAFVTFPTSEPLAASFSCSKVSTVEERLICSDPHLSAVDGGMGKAFSTARRQVTDKAALLADQRRWLRSERSKCLRLDGRANQIGCLIVATEGRRDQLLRYSAIGRIEDRKVESRQSSPMMSNSLLGERIRGRCHMDTCTWFNIENRELVGRNRVGDLYRIERADWSSMHPEGSYETPAPLTGGLRSVSFAFCSLTAPTVLYKIDDGWLADRLSPGFDEGVFGYNESSYMLYFAACHDLKAKDSTDFTTFGLRLGYRAHPERVEQVPLRRPEDILGQ